MADISEDTLKKISGDKEIPKLDDSEDGNGLDFDSDDDEDDLQRDKSGLDDEEYTMLWGSGKDRFDSLKSVEALKGL